MILNLKSNKTLVDVVKDSITMGPLKDNLYEILDPIKTDHFITQNLSQKLIVEITSRVISYFFYSYIADPKNDKTFAYNYNNKLYFNLNKVQTFIGFLLLDSL